MADPASLALAAVGAGASIYGATQMSKGSQAAPAAPNVPIDPSTPAQAPGQKPAKKSQQQSFLSGAASLQQSGSGGLAGSSGGKSLLGQ